MVAVTTEADNTFSGKFVTLFSKSLNVAMTTTVDTLFTVHDRVVVSHNDGSSWAVAIGTILTLTYSSSSGDVEVCVLIDKPLPTDSTVLYRIDQAPGYSRGSVPSTLADFCVSDSERYRRTCTCIYCTMYSTLWHMHTQTVFLSECIYVQLV